MPVDTVFLVLLAVIVVAVVVVLSRAGRKKDQSLLMMQSQLDALRTQVQQSLDTGNQNINQQMAGITKLFMDTIGQINTGLSEQMRSVTENVANRLKENVSIIQQTQSSVGERLDSASKVIADLKGKIGQIEESNKQIFELGKELNQLQNLLKAPKFRGGMAEFMLAELLAQILPPEYYSLQHNFRSGRVDAVIRLGNGLIPIDAKFPMGGFNDLINAQEGEEPSKISARQFRTSVRKHIDDIADKYILPDEGTFDFALMYIPAENVYYEVILKDERDDKVSILDHALKKNVIPVSPNSFYAYLQTILLGLRGMKIEKQAQSIIRGIQQLQGDFRKFEGEFQTLGGHISRTASKYRDIEGHISRFGDNISRISDGSSDAKQLEVSLEDDTVAELDS
ncbi:MAG: DNA recombination protein RmuC [Nitrospirota bacterium]|nr:MAG: DNA recombination protein RmuC [Nitrospirota bacterium]